MQLRYQQNWFTLNRNNHPFIDLSSAEFEGSRGDQEYYGFYADHNPSKSISLFDSQSKFSGGEYMQSENLCSVDSGQVKSAESHYSKLVVYKESKISINPCSSSLITKIGKQEELDMVNSEVYIELK